MLIKRIFSLSNGNRVFFTRNPPFGLWSVSYARGGVPSKLSGMYTSFNAAYKSVQGHLQDKKVEIEEEEPWLGMPEQ